MVFSSLTFLFIFLPITLLLYYVMPSVKARNVVLLIASLLFYAWGEPIYVVLMIISVLLNYYIGRDLEKTHSKGVLAFGVIINILVLGYYKYSGFLIGSFNSVTGLNAPIRELALPIGISFYTFQAMSYIIDVYRGKSHAQDKLLPFAVYITMFPQLIAGPIVKYADIEASLNNRKWRSEDFAHGVLIFIKGLGKKVILANTIGAIFESIRSGGNSELSVVTAWIGALAYTLQLFNDFSGYSDMAIGLGKMLGFTFPKNFDKPYRSLSITEFWRRWHISLGTWFREYLYIPLGGNRVNAFRQILNIIIVWTVTGLWHGAAWNFVIWGAYYGVLLVFEKFVWRRFEDKIPVPIRWLLTFVIVVIGWVIFFAEGLDDLIGYVSAMFGIGHGLVGSDSLFIVLGSLGIMALGFIPSVYEWSEKRPAWLKWVLAILIFVVSVAFIVSDTYNPFLYFRF